MSAVRYSRMYAAGRSKLMPHMFSTTIWWDRPMPRRSRLSVAICTVRACWASIIGCRGYTGTTPVPSPMPGTWEPATARSVSASGPKICEAKAWSSPASRYRCSTATTSGSGLSVSSMLPMRSGLAMSLVLLA